MTTADYALIVSLLSFVVALGSLTWSVWAKFIFPKPRVRVSIAVVTEVQSSGNVGGLSRVSLDAVNFGPGVVKLSSAQVKISRGMLRKPARGIATPLPDFYASDDAQSNPLGGGLGRPLHEAEELAVYFPFHEASFLKNNVLAIGFSDIYGRMHWAPRHQVKRATQRFHEKFPDAKPDPTPPPNRR